MAQTDSKTDWHVIDGSETTELGPLMPEGFTRIEFGPLELSFNPGQSWVATIHSESGQTFLGSIPIDIIEALHAAGIDGKRFFGFFVQPYLQRCFTGGMREGDHKRQELLREALGILETNTRL